MSCSFIYKWECDYWTMTSGGETREFEIKISRSDFFTDAKKEKHSSDQGANYFYYVCPDGLIKSHEVDPRYGLIYIINKYGRDVAEVVKKPKRLHDRNFDKWQELAIKCYWKFHNLWREKYKLKEINFDEYREGFNISLDPCQ